MVDPIIVIEMKMSMSTNKALQFVMQCKENTR
jgi:hypothetical protein